MAVSQTDQFDRQVLQLVNQERTKRNLKPLSLSEKLDTAADLHSKDMAMNDYFSHTGKNGSSPGTRIEKAGYTKWTTWGENIAAGQTTPESVVRAWMNSPGHRANILNPRFTHMGLGYTFLANDTGRVNYRHYWTQTFAAGDPNPGQYSSQNALSTAAYTSLQDGGENDLLLGSNRNELLVGNRGSRFTESESRFTVEGRTDRIANFYNELAQIERSPGLTFDPSTVQSGTDSILAAINPSVIDSMNV